MLRIKENTTLVPVTELRTRAKEILKEAEGSKIILELHHKPVAILMSLKTYELYEKIMDWAEDEYFAKIAKDRTARKGKWISHEKIKKSAGLS